LGGRITFGEPLAWLEAHVDFSGDECLPWPYGLRRGYAGRVAVDGKEVAACRYMCQLAHGAPPTPKHHAAHSCGKGHKGCINPQHLRWATPTENEADKIEHGTSLYGEKHNMAKLDASIVLHIREQVLAGRRMMDIAKHLGVNHTTISLLVKGKTWRSAQRDLDKRPRS